MIRRSGRRWTCTVASVMMPRRPSLPSTISRTLGPVDVCGTGRALLDAREARGGVDLEHAVQPAQVERDHRPLLLGRRLEAAGDVRPAAERDDDGVGVEDRPHDRLDLGLAAGPDDGVGQAAELAAAVADEVAQALATRVHDAIERGARDVRRPDGRLEGGAQVIVEGGLGDVERLERDGTLGRRLDVDVDRAPDERPEVGLVLVREGDALVTPAPPFHRPHSDANAGRMAPRSIAPDGDRPAGPWRGGVRGARLGSWSLTGSA